MEKALKLKGERPGGDRVIQLDPGILKTLKKSRKDVDEGRVISHELFRKEVKVWIKNR